MPIFKCKMCGGNLEVCDNSTIVECEYCGAKQTIPTNKDEKIHVLFNRANTLRIKAEFDKASEIYEKIIELNPTESEAYWGLILCKYGIEYVEDSNLKRVPTCHRTSYDSILADEDYKTALKYAEINQKQLYEDEAETIDNIQKGILEISNKEEPFDIFICYKETDENGDRTKDSAIANDIYYQLTQESYKVFYAPITLEDKLGVDYEPYIFSALNTSKVMLALGTRPEYFTAPWVKNEWSRFLQSLKTDRSKLLIPCYKDMDAYDLPEEFSHLQAQDMSKIGFINDVVRGINKVFQKNILQNNRDKDYGSNNNRTDTEPLLKRMYMFLEDEEWENADKFCEQVLNIDPENAHAYLGKLLCKLHLKNKTDLENYRIPFDNDNDYKKAIRFADEPLKAELTGYSLSILQKEYDKKYLKAIRNMNIIKTEKDAINVANAFNDIGNHRDSSELREKCLSIAKELRLKEQFNNAKKILDLALTKEDIEQAAIKLKEINIDENEEISSLISSCENLYESRNERAKSLWDSFVSVKSQYKEFEDSKNKNNHELSECLKKIKENSDEKEKLINNNNELSKTKDEIKNSSKVIEDLENKLNIQNEEYNRLGIFDLNNKKMYKESIISLTNQLNIEKEKILGLKKHAESLNNSISLLKQESDYNNNEIDYNRRINLLNNELNNIEKNSKEIFNKYNECRKEMLDAKYLATLLSSNDRIIFDNVVCEFVDDILLSNNKKLFDILQKNMLFYSLPNDVCTKLKKNMKDVIDIEAIYYQATQALLSNDEVNILWAKKQFESIIGYKDSDIKISECNKKIAGV